LLIKFVLFYCTLCSGIDCTLCSEFRCTLSPKYSVKTIKEVNLIDQPNIINGKKLIKIKKKDDLTLLSYSSDYFFVKYKNIKGYVFYVSLEGVEGTEDFKSFWIKRTNEIAKINAQQEQKSQKNQKLEELTNRYGSENAKKNS